MRFIITFVQKSLFQDYIPVFEMTWHSEGLEYVYQGFEMEYPEFEILDIN
jgi:hypothetical protein